MVERTNVGLQKASINVLPPHGCSTVCLFREGGLHPVSGGRERRWGRAVW